jgi:hypothetical protein
MNNLELQRAEDGGFIISGIYYTKEEGQHIQNFVDVECYNDLVVYSGKLSSKLKEDLNNV